MYYNYTNKMRKLFITAVLAFGMNATAQTTTTINGNISAANGKVWIAQGNGNINTQGQINVGVGAQTILTANGDVISSGTNQSANFQTKGGKVYINGSNGNITTTGTFNANGNATIDASNGNIWARGTTTAQGGLKVFNGAQITGGLDVQNSKITNVANGINDKDAVNVSQLNLKADKVQVAQDIAKAKQEANTYTDLKVKAVNDKLDLEIEANKIAQKKLDDKINSNDEKINQRVRDLEIKIDNRFNGVMSYVTNEFNAVNNRLEGLGASMVALSAAATSSVYNPTKPTNLNIATGVYGRGYAIAGGLSHFFNDSTKVSVNWSNGSNTKNAVGVGVGFAF